MHLLPTLMSPPYALPSDIVYFHDWRYVNQGGYRWLSESGQSVSMWSRDPVGPMRYETSDLPFGIRLEAMKPALTDPVLTPQMAGVPLFTGGTLLHEDGLYRLWYECHDEDQFDPPRGQWAQEDTANDETDPPIHAVRKKGIGHFNYLRYAESSNGYDWKFPSLGLRKFHGSTNNNIVIDPSLTPRTGYHGGTVFRDPSAPDEERYKSLFMGLVDDAMVQEYLARRPNDVVRARTDINPAICGAVSPDGLCWTPLPNVLVLQGSDTANVCEYDPRLGRYVAYCRTWVMHRRAIARMETEDFRHFSVSQPLFWPNAASAPCETWYANAKSLMPGTSDYHVMFPMRWKQTDDRFDFFCATSPDNMTWGFVPGGPVVEPGERARAWNAGGVNPNRGLVDLPDGSLAMMVGGTEVPHKHPRTPPLGAAAWAIWPRGRLVALCADNQGAFALWPLKVSGRTMHVNYDAGPSGNITIEASGPEGEVLPGRGFDECDRLTGDETDRVVTWQGDCDLGHPADAPVTLRFRLQAARLFSVSFA